MTAREHRLRVQIDRLMDSRDELERQRDSAISRVARLERRLGYQSRHCRYCGTPTDAKDGACYGHRDLPRLEAI